MNKIAIVTGITGQDGSILCELFLEQHYKVYGIKRRNSTENLGNAAHLEKDIDIIEADISDLPSIQAIVKSTKPHLFINAAAQSHVGTSFEQPIYTSEVTGLGVLNCLEAIKISGIHTKFLQMSTSEMFGGAKCEKYTENSLLEPKSPYAAAKCFGHYMTKIYRESYNMFASTAICFNHEEPGRRGPNFVTRKITLGIANIIAGKIKHISLGNIDARRDWGKARDYCKGLLKILEHQVADDFILATGETHSVADFCKIAFRHAGLGDYKKYIKIDPKLYRPNEVEVLIGDATKAKNILGWTSETSFDSLVKQMVNIDISLSTDSADIEMIKHY